MCVELNFFVLHMLPKDVEKALTCLMFSGSPKFSKLIMRIT